MATRKGRPTVSAAPVAAAPSKAKTTGGAAGAGFLTPTPSITVSVRKIANGFVASRSGMDGEKYVNQERFFPEMPKAGK